MEASVGRPVVRLIASSTGMAMVMGVADDCHCSGVHGAFRSAPSGSLCFAPCALRRCSRPDFCDWRGELKRRWRRRRRRRLRPAAGKEETTVDCDDEKRRAGKCIFGGHHAHTMRVFLLTCVLAWPSICPSGEMLNAWWIMQSDTATQYSLYRDTHWQRTSLPLYAYLTE